MLAPSDAPEEIGLPRISVADVLQAPDSARPAALL